MVQIALQTVGRGRVVLDLPHDATVADLRAAAAATGGLAAERTKLVTGGRVLLDVDGQLAGLADGA